MVHMILDAARMKNALWEAKEINEMHVSLYRGRSEEVLAGFAPYLFRYSAGSSFHAWFWLNGWGKSWGVLAGTRASDADVYKHFRRFLLVNSEEGEQLYFRFYDPRVLRVFLRTCDDQQLHDFFGPIEYFLVEDKNSDYGTYYWLESGKLKTETSARFEIENSLRQNNL